MEDHSEHYTVAWNRLGMVVIVDLEDKMEVGHLTEWSTVADLEELLMEQSIAVADLEELLMEQRTLQLVEEHRVLNIETF